MNRQIAKLGAGLLVCYLLLFAQLNRVRCSAPSSSRTTRSNNRAHPARLRRGPGARSSPPTGSSWPAPCHAEDDPLRAPRTYPEGDLFAHTVGYFSLNLGADRRRGQLQRRAGRPDPRPAASATSSTCSSTATGSATSRSRCGPTCSGWPRTQLGERAGLGRRPRPPHRRHPRVVVVPLASTPTCSPPRTSSRQRRASPLLDADPTQAAAGQDLPRALLPRVDVQGRHRHRRSRARARSRPSSRCTRCSASYTPPQTSRPLRNFGGEPAAATFRHPRVSCNTAFAQMAVDARRRADDRHAPRTFGFNAAAADRPARAGASSRRSPTDFDQNLPGAGPGRHRPERRGGHAAADGAGGRRGRQRGRDHDAPRGGRRPRRRGRPWSTNPSRAPWRTSRVAGARPPSCGRPWSSVAERRHRHATC